MITMNIHELETALKETIKELKIVHPSIGISDSHQYFEATLLSEGSNVLYLALIYQLYTIESKKHLKMIVSPQVYNVPALMRNIASYTKEYPTDNSWFILTRDDAKYQSLKLQDPLQKFKEFKEHFLKYDHIDTHFRIKTEKVFPDGIYTTFIKVYAMHEPHNEYISAQYTHHNNKPLEPAITQSHPDAYGLFNHIQEYLSQEMQSEETQCISIESPLYDKPFCIYM